MAKSSNASAANSKRAKAAMLEGIGLPSKIIAEQAGCTVYTLSRWRSEPAFAEMVEKARERLEDKLTSVHAYSQSAAASYLVSVIQDKVASPEMRMEAAKVVLTWKHVPAAATAEATAGFDAVLEVLKTVKA